MRIPVLAALLACISCSTHHREIVVSETVTETLTVPAATRIKDSIWIQDSIHKTDSILHDLGRPVRLGHITVLKGLIPVFTNYNNFGSLQVKDIMRLQREGFVKPDLYVLSAGFGFDENHERRFVVKFINLTNKPIKEVQIGNIITNTGSPEVNSYFSSHQFYIAAEIQSMSTRSVAFLPHDQEIQKEMRSVKTGKPAIIYDIAFHSASGERFSSSKNISRNLKWRYN